MLGDFPCGPCHVGDLAHVFNGRLYQTVDFEDHGRWGNLLANYWAGRAIASLGGVAFASCGRFEEHMDPWSAFLPRWLDAQPSEANCTAFAAACEQCNHLTYSEWFFPSLCSKLWRPFRARIASDTRAAMKKWARLHARPWPPPQMEESIVIQSRCSEDTWIGHPQYGQTAFSHFDAIPANTTRRIVIVTELGALANHAGCAAKNTALVRRLRRRHPNASHVDVLDGDLFDGFAAMAFAHELFRDSSSLSVWAGLANERAVIWSPREGLNMDDMGDPELLRRTTAPVLFPGRAVNEFNFSTTEEGITRMVKWLEDN